MSCPCSLLVFIETLRAELLIRTEGFIVWGLLGEHLQLGHASHLYAVSKCPAKHSWLTDIRWNISGRHTYGQRGIHVMAYSVTRAALAS